MGLRKARVSLFFIVILFIVFFGGFIIDDIHKVNRALCFIRTGFCIFEFEFLFAGGK